MYVCVCRQEAGGGGDVPSTYYWLPFNILRKEWSRQTE